MTMLIFRNKKNTGQPASNVCVIVAKVGSSVGLSAGDTVALSVGDNSIGRDADCEVVIKGPTVSRRHACLRVSHGKGQLVLTDLGSVNGTLVLPDIRLRGESRVLQLGDEIRIGEVVMRLAASDQDQEAYTIAVT